MRESCIIDVIIIVEHLNRELESALLLESELQRRGLSVAVVFKGWNEGPASVHMRPKVVVTPWCYDSFDVEALRGYRGGFSDSSFFIVDLHSEQVTSKDGMDFVLPSGEARGAEHLCWGDFFKNALLADGIASESVHVVGSNRLDPFRSEYRYLSASKKELACKHSLDEGKKWVLVVGNYSYAFKSEDELASIEGRGVKNARLNASVARQTYAHALQWAERLAERDYADNLEFIYRPHPSEPVSEELLDIEASHRSFHVIKKGPIRDWFLNSELAIMWNSTSSVEAAYAGLPILALRPVEIPDSLRFDLLEKIEQVASFEELDRMVRRAAQDRLPALNEEFRFAIGYYYHRGEKSATDSIADVIQNLISTGKGPFTCSRGACYGLRKDAAYAVKEILYRLGLAKWIGRLRTLSEDHITARELRRMRKDIHGRC